MLRRSSLCVAFVVLLVLCAGFAFAADTANGEPDTSWTVIGYIVGALFNIGVVAALRSKAANAGKQFLQSGRFAMVAVFTLCFVELLITGRFAALENSTAFVALLKQASVMTTATLGAHTASKTTGINDLLLKLLSGGAVVAAVVGCLLLCGVATPARAQQSGVIAPAAIEKPALQSSFPAAVENGQANLLEDMAASFSAAYAHSLKTDAEGLIGMVGAKVAEMQLAPDRSVDISLNVAAVPTDGKAKFGLGASATLHSGNLNMGLGLAYLPEPYEWSATLTLYQR